MPTMLEAFVGLLAAPFARKFERKESRFGQLFVRLGGGQPVYPDRNQHKLAVEGYTRSLIASACINLVAEGAASIPMMLFDGPGSKAKEIEEHPLLELLSLPNRTQDGVAFAIAIHSFELITGNSYLERVDGIGGEPRELHTIRPDRIKVIPGPYGPSGFEITIEGQVRRVSVNIAAGVQPIMQMKLFNPIDDWYGMSPLQPAGWSIDTHYAAGAMMKYLLDNMAVPSGALTVMPDKEGPITLDKQHKEQLQKDLDERFSGRKNIGRPMILDGGLAWTPFGMNMVDMQFGEQKSDAARDIARAFGVPPMILGIPGDNTYSNYQEANTALWKQTIIPRAQRVARALSLWLCPSFGAGLELRCDLDQLDALAEDRAQAWERALKAMPFLTLNEVRDAVGYEPIDGGDTVLVASSLVPLDLALEPPEPTPVAAPKAPPAVP